MSAKSSGVQAFVRIRPTSNFAQDTIELMPDNKTINVHIKKDARKGVVNNQQSDWSFKMDGILQSASQDSIYDAVARQVVSRALDGYSGTILCYGQTGAGKTYTMTGATENYTHRGIIPRALQQIFRGIEERPDQAISIYISYFEIYNESLFDLLTATPDTSSLGIQMTIVDDAQGVHIKGLSMYVANNEEEALNLLFEGETNRMIASHAMNKNSSRSHCIFTIYVQSHSRTLSDAKYVTSKLNLVDLAGSERLGKTGSEGQVLKEATYINKSLSFLEQAVIALSDRKREHVPFRQSKLTHALKDSIGGRCLTVLVANIYGEAMQIEETLSTLRFATRMKCIAAEPAVEEHYDPERLVKNLEQEIKILKQELAMHNILTNRNQVNYEPLSENQITEINRQVRRYLEGSLTDIEVVSIRQLQEVFNQFKQILNRQEQEIESRLRQRYTLIDRTDSAAVAAAHKAGLIDIESQLVGEIDGHGFGIGTAPLSSKPNSSSVLSVKKAKFKKTKEQTSPIPRKDGVGTPTASYKEHESPSNLKTIQLVSSVKDMDSKEILQREELTSVNSQHAESVVREEVSQPSSPPPKASAFEEFKMDPGSEINMIFNENKAILAEKRKEMKQLSQRINSVKQEIDIIRQALGEKKQEREKQGQYLNEDGQLVIDEDEYLLIIKLKELKACYHSDYEEIRNLKAEVQYCQHLVDQCRQRLLSEFEIWYNESFIIPEEVQNSLRATGSIRPGMLPLERIKSLEEDDQERLDRLQQELLMENPDAVAFYNAKMKADQRNSYKKAMLQIQTLRRKPGEVIPTVKNKPPSVLSVA
ncbi:kinesin-like protein KIF9 [Protopterus annectens]|uniref:kinesin-like protein KIF9 n=1 Tax=Protopterus annectens TaxID=7888 RepID=UPI001CFBAF37|nr:kinesin-like protein KIF9 [Protopterus annectens]